MLNAPEPCVLVIFGASGDLTQRKLVPAMYELARWGRSDVSAHGCLPTGFAIVGVSRTPMSDEQFRERMRASCREHASGWDEDRWRAFAPRLHYHAADAGRPESMAGLAARVNAVAREHGVIGRMPEGGGGGPAGSTPNVLFYLSVAPGLYEPIISSIGASGMVAEGQRWCAIDPHAMPWQRIIVEKPFGSDLASAESLNKALGRVFEEEAIYRIDHYLGKELVQNIAVMRFGNAIFEPLWNSRYIDHVQVTAAETIGVGSRAANFYDEAGALRDMVQSHLLQVLALVAIEPPSVFEAAAVMREKIKLFNSARAITARDAVTSAALGRYGPSRGARGDEPGYADEKGVDGSRRTETYAALRVEFENWRWAGVPFYLRSGKKLAKKLTEVVVQFKRPPVSMFRRFGEAMDTRSSNRLIIHIAPTEGLSLELLGKVPGMGMKVDSARLSMDYLERFGGEKVEAYGPLILDAMRGDRTLYKHRDEVEGSWRICQAVLESKELRDRLEEYAPGSWGPASADALLARDGRAWHNP